MEMEKHLPVLQSVQIAAYYPLGTVGLSTGVMRPGREADNLDLSSGDVKNAFSCTFFLHISSCRDA
jgi:hypothetical protein